MGILSYLNPIELGSTNTNNVSEATTSDSTTKAPLFSCILEQAQCDYAAVDQVAEEAQGSSVISTAIDIGLFAATGNPLLAASPTINVIQGLMSQGVTSDFATLGTDIASTFIDGLAGKSSATELAATTLDSSAEAAIGAVADIVDDKVSPLTGGIIDGDLVKGTVNGISQNLLSDRDILNFRKGYVPWNVDKETLLETLEKQLKG